MNALALITFAFWALFMCYLPSIVQFLRIRKFASTIPGPSIGELIENAKKGREWKIKLLFMYVKDKIEFFLEL